MRKSMVAAMLMAGVMAASLVGCGSVSVTTTNTSSNSESTVITDQGGAEHEVTHKTVTENGVTKEYYENVVFGITNTMDEPVSEFYLATSGSEEWGESLLLVGGEAHTLGKDASAYGFEIDFSTDESSIDVKIVTEEGNEVTFAGFDLMGLEGANEFTFILTFDAENESYNLSVES